MLREASESERPELRQKLDDLLFNEECPYDSVSDADALWDKYFSYSPATIFKCLLQIRLGLPGWKSRFFREYFGAKTSTEIGKLQNDLVMFLLVYLFVLTESLFLGKLAFYICYNLPTFLPLSSR